MYPQGKWSEVDRATLTHQAAQLATKGKGHQLKALQTEVQLGLYSHVMSPLAPRK